MRLHYHHQSSSIATNQLFLTFTRNNQLSSLPEGFVERLSGLYLLFLDYNKLKQLPNTIRFLNKLELLRIDKNELESLPEGMDALTNLIGNVLFLLLLLALKHDI